MLSSLFQPLIASETSGVYYAFVHSDAVGQGIVVILSIFSVVTWCIMLAKGMALKRAHKGSRRMLSEMRSRRDPMEIRPAEEDQDIPAVMVHEHFLACACKLLKTNEPASCEVRRPFSKDEISVIRSSMEEAVAEQIEVLEEKVIFLMTAVSIAPFLGLFGTVWGIMLAFTEMAIAGRPDITTLAPGVSGALLTTVLGLIVAIPSLIGYNFVTHSARQTTVLLDNYVEETASKLELLRITAESKAQGSKVMENRMAENRMQEVQTAGTQGSGF